VLLPVQFTNASAPGAAWRDGLFFTSPKLVRMKITVGLPYKHLFSLSGYSAADGWSIAGKLSDAAGTYDLAASLFSGDGAAWTLAIPEATTATYESGDVTLYLIATKASDSEVALEQPVAIVALGAVSHARQMVTKLEALSKQLATKKYVTLSTSGGESITLDREGVEAQLKKYRRELASELRPGGTRVKNIKLGFGQ